MNGDLTNDPREISEVLDAALDATFPASDPPSMTVPVTAGPSAGLAPASAQVQVFRVVRREKADAAFASVENRHAGRWTSEGTAAVYASMSAAGALLEFLAHLEGDSPADLVLIAAALPTQTVVVANQLPSKWRERPYRDDVRAFGDRWATSRRSLALKLPSVLCESADNVLINPDHPDAFQLNIRAVDPLVVDPRLRY